LRFMLDGLALSIGSTSSRVVTRVLTLVGNARFVIATIGVGSASDDAISFETNFLIETVGISETSLNTMTLNAKFSLSAVFSEGARRSASSLLTDQWSWTSSVIFAEWWNPHTSNCTIVRFSSESMGAVTTGFVFIDTADGIWSTGTRNGARRFTHRHSSVIADTSSIQWTVAVTVWTFVGVATSWSAIGISDMAVKWAFAVGTTKPILTYSRWVAWICLSAVVD
jgi:hypothetical protein